MKYKQLIRALSCIACVILAIILALIFSPPQFYLKSFLQEQGMLENSISFLTIIGASLVGGLILAIVNEKVQTYSWKRDQALIDVEKIYLPLYEDTSYIVRQTSVFNWIYGTMEGWASVYGSILGAKLQIMGPNLYRKLQEFFNDYSVYTSRLHDAEVLVTGIARHVVKERLDESISRANLTRIKATDATQGKPENVFNDTEGVNGQLIDEIADAFDYRDRVFKGFLKGKSAREWGLIIFCDGNIFIDDAIKSLNKSAYWEILGLSDECSKEVEAILDEILRRVQIDKAINEIIDWCKDFEQRAIQLNKELEKRVIEPQLS